MGNHEDLFGDPVPRLKRGGVGYLTELASLDLDGWQFWGLAMGGRASRTSCEWVWLVKDGRVRHALIDLETGTEATL
jgi:hypothetical protein